MSTTPETDAAFADIYKPPYRVGLKGLAKLITLMRRMEVERIMLAKLAADSPQFYSTAAAWEAQRLRDFLLNQDAQAKEAKP